MAYTTKVRAEQRIARRANVRIRLTAGAWLAVAGLSIALSSACSSGETAEPLSPEVQDALDEAGVQTLASAGDAPATAAFYSTVRDVRRCAWPRCGGYFIRAANRALTRCSDGTLSDRCYVAEIDWSALGGTPDLPTRESVVVGVLRPNVIQGEDFGAFHATAAWSAATVGVGSGAYFALSDSGIRCITEPCFSITAELLNFSADIPLSGLDLSRAGASDAQLDAANAALADGTLLASGRLRLTTGNAGLGLTLDAAQFYLPADRAPWASTAESR